MKHSCRTGARPFASALMLTAYVASSALSGCSPVWRPGGLQERLSRACYEHKHAELEPLARQIHEAERRSYGDDAPRTLADLRMIANMISWSGRTEQGVHAGELALAEHRRVYGAGDYRTGPALKNLGDLLADAGRSVDAEEAYDSAAAVCRQAPAANKADAAHSSGQQACGPDFNRSISVGYRTLGLYEKAEPFLVSYLTGDYRLAAPQFSAGDLDDLGDFYFEYGHYPKALWYYRACKRLWEKVHPAAAATTTPVYQAPGVKVMLGNGAHAFYSVAPSCLEDYIEATERAGRSDESALLRRWEERAWQSADTDAAERELVHDIERELGSDWFTPLSAAYQYEALGFLYNKKGRYAEASLALEQAHRRQRENWALLSQPEQSQNLSGRLDSLLLRGDNAAAGGDIPKAEASYLAFEALAQSLSNSRHRWRLDATARLGRLYFRSGRYDQALSAWQLYLAQAERSRGRGHLDYAWGQAEIALVYQKMGRTAQADQASRTAQAIRAAHAAELDTIRDLPLPAALQSGATVANDSGT